MEQPESLEDFVIRVEGLFHCTKINSPVARPLKVPERTHLATGDQVPLERIAFVEKRR
jgi:hypothetical protein